MKIAVTYQAGMGFQHFGHSQQWHEHSCHSHGCHEDKQGGSGNASHE